MASPDSAPPDHQSRATARLIGFTAAANLAIAWFFASGTTFRRGWPQTLQLWLVFQLVPLLALALLIPRRTRAAGIGMALAAAAGLGLASFLFLTAQGLMPFYFGWPALQIVILVPIVAGMLHNGARAAKALDQDAAGRAALGAVMGVVLAASTWSVTARVRQARQETREAAYVAVSQNEAAAAQLLRTAAECVRQYGRDHPAKGFPSSLGALRPAGSACLTEEGAAGRAHGYEFQYTPALPDASGRIQMFTLCARPTQFRVTGVSTFAEDEAGPMGLGQPPSDRMDSLPCAAAWTENYDSLMTRLKHCVLRFAAEHPDRGYPDHLDEIKDCLHLSHPLRIEDDRLRMQGRTTFVYLPRWPEAGDRVTRFEIHRTGVDSQMFDESGTVRGTNKKPSDPPAWFRPNLGHLKRLCDQGEPESCFALGMALREAAKSGQPGEALGALENACKARLARACLEWGRLLRVTQGAGVHMPSCAAYHRSCALGEGEGCWIAGNSCVAEHDLARARELFEQGCDRGFSMSCVAAAERDLRSESPRWPPARLVAVLEEACSETQTRACVLIGRFYRYGHLVEKDLARARYYLRRACALSDEPCEQPPARHARE